VHQDEITAWVEQDLTLVKVGYLGMIGDEERVGGMSPVIIPCNLKPLVDLTRLQARDLPANEGQVRYPQHIFWNCSLLVSTRSPGLVALPAQACGY
jgi:hypothetical protein